MKRLRHFDYVTYYMLCCIYSFVMHFDIRMFPNQMDIYHKVARYSVIIKGRIRWFNSILGNFNSLQKRLVVQLQVINMNGDLYQE